LGDPYLLRIVCVSLSVHILSSQQIPDHSLHPSIATSVYSTILTQCLTYQNKTGWLVSFHRRTLPLLTSRHFRYQNSKGTIYLVIGPHSRARTLATQVCLSLQMRTRGRGSTLWKVSTLSYCRVVYYFYIFCFLCCFKVTLYHRYLHKAFVPFSCHNFLFYLHPFSLPLYISHLFIYTPKSPLP
jgi:hypothetical protein